MSAVVRSAPAHSLPEVIAPGAADARAAATQATVSVGMAVALGAVLMTFGAVLLAYVTLRVQAPHWPPPGEAPAPALWPWPALASILALLGSGALVIADRGFSRVAEAVPSAAVRRGLLCAAVAGLLFLAVQATAWTWLVRGGVRPDSGLLASMVFGLTVFHALHALAAVLALSPLVVRAWLRRSLRRSTLRAVASFWHLVTALWMVVFLAVFVA